MKTQDEILKTLLDLDNYHGDFFNLKSSLELGHPELTQEEINDALNHLKRMKLISTPTYKMKGSSRFIKVNPEAYSYYQNREARYAAEAAARDESHSMALEEIEDWEERSWNYKMIGIGFAAGLVSGIFLMWVKAAFTS